MIIYTNSLIVPFVAAAWDHGGTLALYVSKIDATLPVGFFALHIVEEQRGLPDVLLMRDRIYLSNQEKLARR